MARGRMINTTVADDVRLNNLSIESHFLFLMTIPHLDRDGLIKADGMVFAGRVFPRRPELLPRMNELIGEWIDCALVIAYDTDTHGRILCFPNFAKNQIGLRYNREPASELPPPPGYTRTADGLTRSDTPPTTNGKTPEPSQPTPDTVQTNSRIIAGSLPENIPPKRREEKRKEREENGGGGDVALTVDGSRRHFRQDDTDYGKICAVYEKEFGFLSPIAADQLSDILNEYKSTQMILDAFAESVTSNKRSLRYVEGILRNWRAEGKNGKTAKQPAKSKALPVIAGRIIDNPFSL